MSGDERPQYAERLFPAPIEHGIAGRTAVSSVVSGVDNRRARSWRGNRWYEAAAVGEKAVERIVIYPPTRGVQTQGIRSSRSGSLLDRHGPRSAARGLHRPVHPRDRDALNEGIYDRPVEILTVDARGLRGRTSAS